MPQYYYTSSPSPYKTVIHDPRYDSGSQSGRDSSTDSRASYYSSSSSDYVYQNRWLQGSSGDSKYKYRVPDNDNYYVTKKRYDNLDVTHQQKPRYDADEPRASEATHSEYKSSSSSSRSGGSKGKSSSSSGHKHSHSSKHSHSHSHSHRS